MKKAKKLTALMLLAAFVFAFIVPVTAMAKEVSPTNTANQGNGSITINNAAKGETYKLYRLFDATVSTSMTGDKSDSIAYTGNIPNDLTTYFEKDKNGYISAKEAAWKNATTKTEMSEELQKALESWAKTATEIVSAESDGTTLVFDNLKYGYYVVVSTQGAAISVDSTNPNATITDKNSATPSDLTKTVNDDDVNIGDTVTYTVKFKTSNYDGAGANAKKIVEYTIEDTLPAFLSNVQVTSIVVDDNDDTTTNPSILENGTTPQFGGAKKITIDWYDEANGQFLYKNGAYIIITYTATVTDKAAIAGIGNTNKVTLKWKHEGDTDYNDKNKLETEETISTYAIALKKVDPNGKALAGAKFQFPFYVNETPDGKDGAYIYAGTNAGAGLINVITTPDNGEITIKGVASGEYEITETEAPAGYNKIITPFKVKAIKTSETSTNTVVYLDEQGEVTEKVTTTVVKYENNTIATEVKVVVNKSGLELPSTGGMGTTIFYVLGAVLVVGAGVLLVTKKRMSNQR